MYVITGFFAVLALAASFIAACFALYLDKKDEEKYKKEGVSEEYIKASFMYTHSTVYFILFLILLAITLGNY